jgi:hypothetical protein
MLPDYLSPSTGFRVTNGLGSRPPGLEYGLSVLLRPHQRSDFSVKAVISPKLVAEIASSRLASGRSCRCFFQDGRVTCSRHLLHQEAHLLEAHRRVGERPPGCEGKPVPPTRARRRRAELDAMRGRPGEQALKITDLTQASLPAQ